MVRIRRLSTKQGFTVVEALIASFVMAIGLLAVVAAISSQITTLNQNREKAIAALSAQEEIESIRSMPFDDILNLGTSSSFTASGFVYLNNSSGIVTVDNTYGPISSAADARRISVTVNWKSINGKTLQKTLTTLVTRNGINKQ